MIGFSSTKRPINNWHACVNVACVCVQWIQYSKQFPLSGRKLDGILLHRRDQREWFCAFTCTPFIRILTAIVDVSFGRKLLLLLFSNIDQVNTIFNRSKIQFNLLKSQSRVAYAYIIIYRISKHLIDSTPIVNSSSFFFFQ